MLNCCLMHLFVTSIVQTIPNLKIHVVSAVSCVSNKMGMDGGPQDVRYDPVKVSDQVKLSWVVFCLNDSQDALLVSLVVDDKGEQVVVNTQ